MRRAHVLAARGGNVVRIAGEIGMTRRCAAKRKALLVGLFGLAFSVAAGAAQLVWSSGFETGFPGEWLDYDNGAYSPNGTMPAGRVSAWTIVGSENGVAPPGGSHMYKGWITGSASDSHRAYPVLHTDIRTPLVNTFMVYLDADYARMSSDQWIHFGTWGNAAEWAVFTMSVRDRHLVFAHADPFEGEYIGPQPQANFPLRRWVRFTTYVQFDGSNGFAQVWQDGVPMLRARLPQLGHAPGTSLERAHWGMYAGGNTNQGVQYNDDIRICTLSAPLTDLVTEPTCGTTAAKQPKPPGNLRVE
jgi:hypothetical protein